MCLSFQQIAFECTGHFGILSRIIWWHILAVLTLERKGNGERKRDFRGVEDCEAEEEAADEVKYGGA